MVARPRALVTTTSVRSPLANVPPGPSSGRWKLTAASARGLPVSSVISTVRGRADRAPGWRIAPSPSTTWIWRMATWAVIGLDRHSKRKANRNTLPGSASSHPKISVFSTNYFAAESAARTSSLCLDGLTPIHTFATLPEGSIRNVFLAEIWATPKLMSDPYCFETACEVSARTGCPIDCFFCSD